MIGIFVLLILLVFVIIKFCKKTLRIILLSVIVLVSLYSSVIAIEMNRVYSLEAPIFCYYVEDGLDGTFEGTYTERTEIFYGVGYRIENEIGNDNQVLSSTMYMFNKVLAGAVI